MAEDIAFGLMQIWDGIYSNKPQWFNSKPENNETRPLNDDRFHLIYNEELALQSIFPNPEETQVFRSFFEEDSIFTWMDSDRIACYIDVDNETLVMQKADEESKELCEEEVSDSTHPLFISDFPIGRGHYILSLFKDEGLPQVISQELLSLAMTVFRLTQNPSLRLGFDSLGANAQINQLHLHLFFLDQLSQISGLAVESANRNLLHECSLKHRDESEVNMYDVGVLLHEVVDYPLRCFLITPNQEVDPEGDADACEAISTIVGILINHLIDKNVPHNLLISDFGKAVYIFPRKFQPEDVLGFSFLEASGVVRVPKREQYDNMSAEELQNIFKEKVGCTEEVYEETKEFFINLLNKIYI